MTRFKHNQLIERRKPKEERDLLQTTRVFSPLMTSTDYQSFVQGILLERQIRQRIRQLQEYRRMGVTTFTEADEYEKQKAHRIEKFYPVGHGSIASLTATQTTPAVVKEKKSSLQAAAGKYQPTPLDLSGCEGVDQLTAGEQAICSTLRLLPRAYLAIKQTLLKEAERRGGLKRREARSLVRIDVNKLGKVYDFFVSKGWLSKS